jgi:hypothetical protein
LTKFKILDIFYQKKEEECMKKIFLILIILGISSRVFSEPSLFATTGLIGIPTGDVLNVKGFNFSAFRLEGEKINNRKIRTHIYSINYGIIEGLEIGGGTIDKDDPDISGITVLQGKYKIVKETTTNPNLSIGVIYGSRGKKDNPEKEYVTIYAVVSQNLSWPEKFVKKFGIRATLGIGNEILDGVFGGLEFKVGEYTKLICEYDTEDYNFAVRQNLTPAIIGEILKKGENYGIGIIVQIR